MKVNLKGKFWWRQVSLPMKSESEFTVKVLFCQDTFCHFCRQVRWLMKSESELKNELLMEASEIVDDK